MMLRARWNDTEHENIRVVAPAVLVVVVVVEYFTKEE